MRQLKGPRRSQGSWADGRRARKAHGNSRKSKQGMWLARLSLPIFEKAVGHSLCVSDLTSSYRYIVSGLATCLNSLPWALLHQRLRLLPYQPCLRLRACTQNWSKLTFMAPWLPVYCLLLKREQTSWLTFRALSPQSNKVKTHVLLDYLVSSSMKQRMLSKWWQKRINLNVCSSQLVRWISSLTLQRWNSASKAKLHFCIRSPNVLYSSIICIGRSTLYRSSSRKWLFGNDKRDCPWPAPRRIWAVRQPISISICWTSRTQVQTQGNHRALIRGFHVVVQNVTPFQRLVHGRYKNLDNLFRDFSSMQYGTSRYHFVLGLTDKMQKISGHLQSCCSSVFYN